MATSKFNSRCTAFVMVMQATDLRNISHLLEAYLLDRSGLRGILLKR